MWQVALAAAVAGSGFLATRLFNPNAADPDKEIEEKSDLLSTPPEYEGSGFRFSSPDIGSGSGSINGRKKKGECSKGKCGGSRVLEGKKSGSGNGFGVCVKKRRTSKFGPGKCDSCSTSKGDPIFSQGIGLGIMCMMSAGKAEINKLNAAMDETAKVVHELKSELSKRKATHDRQVSSSKLEINADLEELRGKDIPLLPQSEVEFKFNVQNCGTSLSEEVECVRSNLSEEPQGEAMEMDLLEAELESELQKLSWCASDASVPEERRLDSYENGASTEGIYDRDSELSSLFLLNGVEPSVLNQKLCNVLIKQQEGQIVELETELYDAQSKLLEREAELKALKDCVRRMSQFSIANASDEETEEQVKEEKSNAYYTKVGTESKRSIVGMKRSMSFGSYSCHVTPQSI